MELQYAFKYGVGEFITDVESEQDDSILREMQAFREKKSPNNWGYIPYKSELSFAQYVVEIGQESAKRWRVVISFCGCHIALLMTSRLIIFRNISGKKNITDTLGSTMSVLLPSCASDAGAGLVATPRRICWSPRSEYVVVLEKEHIHVVAISDASICCSFAVPFYADWHGTISGRNGSQEAVGVEAIDDATRRKLGPVVDLFVISDADSQLIALIVYRSSALVAFRVKGLGGTKVFSESKQPQLSTVWVERVGVPSVTFAGNTNRSGASTVGRSDLMLLLNTSNEAAEVEAAAYLPTSCRLVLVSSDYQRPGTSGVGIRSQHRTRQALVHVFQIRGLFPGKDAPNFGRYTSESSPAGGGSAYSTARSSDAGPPSTPIVLGSSIRCLASTPITRSFSPLPVQHTHSADGIAKDSGLLSGVTAAWHTATGVLAGAVVGSTGTTYVHFPVTQIASSPNERYTFANSIACQLYFYSLLFD